MIGDGAAGPQDADRDGHGRHGVRDRHAGEVEGQTCAESGSGREVDERVAGVGTQGDAVFQARHAQLVDAERQRQCRGGADEDQGLARMRDEVAPIHRGRERVAAELVCTARDEQADHEGEEVLQLVEAFRERACVTPRQEHAGSHEKARDGAGRGQRRPDDEDHARVDRHEDPEDDREHGAERCRHCGGSADAAQGGPARACGIPGPSRCRAAWSRPAHPDAHPESPVRLRRSHRRAASGIVADVPAGGAAQAVPWDSGATSRRRLQPAVAVHERRWGYAYAWVQQVASFDGIALYFTRRSRRMTPSGRCGWPRLSPLIPELRACCTI